MRENAKNVGLVLHNSIAPRTEDYVGMKKIEADSMGAWVLFSCGFAGKMFDEGERGREKQVKHLKTPRRGRIRHQVHERVLVDCKHVDTTVLDFAPLDVNLLLNCKLLLSTEMQNHL